MKYEVVYAPELRDDFIEANLAETRIAAIEAKLNKIAEHPEPRIVTDRVLNTDFRKISLGDYRLFLFIDDSACTIKTLRFLHRSKCYKSKQINQVVNLLQKISTN